MFTTTERERIRARFSNHGDAAFDKALESALAELGEPEASEQTFDGEGEYNAVALDERPHAIVSLADESGEPRWTVWGQQVVCDRPLDPPVIVRYVTPAEHARWLAELTRLVGVEIARA